MGADLYIESLYDTNRRKYESLFNTACSDRDRLVTKLGGRETKGVYEKPSVKAIQAKVEKYYDKMYAKGYFRDSYNGTSVLWRLNLSWWTDVIPMLNNGFLKGGNLVRFRNSVANAVMVRPTVAELRESHCTVDKKNTPATWHKYYRDKRERLVKFLDTAIDLGEPVRCSL